MDEDFEKQRSKYMEINNRKAQKQHNKTNWKELDRETQYRT